MKKKISKKISNKIITKPNIIKLVDHLHTVYNSLKSDNKKFLVTILCDESEKYEIENTRLGKNAELLDLKRVEKIEIDIIDYRRDKRISIELSQNEYDWSNTFLIEGSDESWVNNHNIKIHDYINSWKPQNKWFSKYKSVLFHFISLNIGLFSIRTLIYLMNSLGYKPEDTKESEGFLGFLMDKMLASFPSSKYLLLGLISWAFGMWILIMFWGSIVRYFDRLWPSIEFDFGPDHKRYPKNKRKAISVVVSLVVIPIILQLLYSL